MRNAGDSSPVRCINIADAVVLELSAIMMNSLDMSGGLKIGLDINAVFSVTNDC